MADGDKDGIMTKYCLSNVRNSKLYEKGKFKKEQRI